MKNDYYYYSGPLPPLNEVETTAIVQVATHPADGKRYGYLFEPPSNEHPHPRITIALFEEWQGEWKEVSRHGSFMELVRSFSRRIFGSTKSIDARNA